MKVREFIHYSRKNPREKKNTENKAQAPTAPAGEPLERDLGERDQLPGFLATNKFALPEDNVPGGPQKV